MTRPRRLIAALTAALALATAGCAGSPDATQPAQPQAGERVVKHAMGETKIKGTPQRVVVLDTGELDSVLALGVKPVGAVRADANQDFQAYLKDQAQGIQMVGSINEPNLEQIVALKPDLILSNKVRHADKYQQLSQIAPTVFAEKVGASWKENFLLAADALGKKPEAQRKLADYENEAKAVGQKAGDPSKIKVSMVRFMPGGTGIRLYGQSSFIGTILDDAGFARPDTQKVDKTFVEINPEQISLAEGDLVFYGAYGAKAKAKQDEIVGGPLWKTISAVNNGKASEVSDDLWYLGTGPIAADQVLDDLEKRLTSPAAR